jgi:hypothetical protein
MIRCVVEPSPRRLLTSTDPPIASIRAFTTSMPTPRPLILVICSAVEKPGRKII